MCDLLWSDPDDRYLFHYLSPEKIALLSLVKISDIHLVFQGWLGNFSSRRRLHFWPGHL